MYKYCQSVSVDNHLIYTIFFSLFFGARAFGEKKLELDDFDAHFLSGNTTIGNAK